jgi:hypothetical protein
VVGGGTAEVELEIFFEDFDNTKVVFPKDYSFTHWFSIGMQSLIPTFDAD